MAATLDHRRPAAPGRRAAGGGAGVSREGPAELERMLADARDSEESRANYDDDDDDCDNGENDDRGEHGGDRGGSEEWIPPTQPPSRPGPQTGPKGVVADYRHHRKQERLRLEAERRRSVAELTKRTAGVSLNDQPTFTQKEERTLNSGMRVAGDSEDDYDEDEFLRQYRTRRLDQLKMDRSTFGAVREIGESGYVDAIDKEPPAVPVIVHIYANHLPPCRRVNECLTALAAKYKLAKFLRIAAGPLQFDEVGLPVLLTYKAGKVVSNHTRVSDELSRIDVDSLEALLLKDGSLSDADIADPLATYVFERVSTILEDDTDS